MQVSGVALLVSKSDGGAVLEVAGRPMFELNPIAAMIWGELAVGLPTEEIIAQLVLRFGISEAQAVGDVMTFIEQLKQHLLVYENRKSTP